jgi:nitrite reductase/ring-hydroxylating ferredoxin subunit
VTDVDGPHAGAWHRVAKLADLAPDQPKPVSVAGLAIALYRIGDAVYATRDLCTHAFACLSDGWLEGEEIECPLHGGRFHVPSGRALGGIVTEDLETYSVRVEDDVVLVRVAAR